MEKSRTETETVETETGCCPRFDPEPWDGQEITFEGRLFLKDRVRSFLHIPLNFGRVMKRCQRRIDEAGASVPEPLLLCDESSPWKTEVYIAIAKEIPDADMERISGTFLTKVFEGPYRDVGKWVRAMQTYVAEKGRTLQRLYTYYTTCPRCAKAYGVNYTVILAQV